MADIIPFPNSPLDVPEMFQGIVEKNDPKFAFVIAWPKDGSMPTFHSNTGDAPVVLMQLQGFIHKFYNGDFKT